MKMEFVESMGFQIAYQVKNPDLKNTIFFIHGNSGSSRLWEQHFNDALFSAYRLIAFDLPAHGQSSASKDPDNDYSVIGLAKIMANAVLLLAPENSFILVGFSLGTNIVVETLAFSLKPRGMILIGADLIGGKYTLQDATMPGTDLSMLFMDSAPEELVTKYIELAILSKNEVDTNLLISDYNRVQSPFRSTLLKTAMSGVFSDEISLLNKSKISTLFVYGADEKLLNPDYLKGADLPIWRNTIFKIPSSGHFVNIDQPQTLNDLLFQYSDQIFTEDYS
jgi:pimeloyl-ACP methyl ester carboxylesterase